MINPRETSPINKNIKYWLVEFKKIKLAFGMAEGRCRICPYCKDTRPISADGVRLSDRFCPNCGKAVKETKNG